MTTQDGSGGEWRVYQRARAAFGRDGPDAGLAILTADTPADPQLWVQFACLAAECHAASGRHRDAIAILERAAARGTENYRVYYTLATQYRVVGDLTTAIATGRQAHALLGWPQSQRNGYVFTHDYFAANITAWTGWFARLITQAPIACLEVGSWQGGSATWLLDQVVAPRGGSLTCIDTFAGSSEHAPWLHTLGSSLETIFDANIARTGHAARCRKLVGASQAVLPTLHAERFDFIYIDGAHEAKLVIQDAVLAWGLLAPGGFLLFDDTHFRIQGHPEQDTATAITAFRGWFGDEIEVLTPVDERQLLIRRR